MLNTRLNQAEVSGAGKEGRVTVTMVVEQGLVGMAMDRKSVCFVGASSIRKYSFQESMEINENLSC